MEFRTVAHAGQRFVISQVGSGADIMLLHGFPDTPHSWSEIAGALAADGWRVTVPWLRGYHPETFVAGRPYDPSPTTATSPWAERPPRKGSARCRG